MGQVTVTVAGRLYRMACGDGEEQRIAALAEGFDAKIAEFKAAVGDIGEMRLHVMAGLYFADEASEQARLLAEARAAIDSLRAEREEFAGDAGERERAAAARLAEVLRRVEALARGIAQPAQDVQP